MTELVILQGKNIFTNSLIIAEGTENEHRSIIRLIQRYEEKLNRWGKVQFTDLKSTNPLGGRPTTVAFLNEQQATFLITLLRNSDVVLDFKSELVDQFYKMREILLQKQNAEWLEVRGAVKDSYKSLSETIQTVLIPLAREQGSTAPDRVFFMNYAKSINKRLGIKSKSRDKLPVGKLYEAEKMQSMANVSIRGLAAKGENYHKIYKNTDKTLENYSLVSMTAQRFLN